MILINHNQINLELSGPTLIMNTVLLVQSILIEQLHSEHSGPK